jgi:hypothetical protein
MKISIDFDMTLGETYIQQLAKLLILGGADVWVLTGRIDDQIKCENKIIGYHGFNKDLRGVCDKVGIPYEKIIYTDGIFKYKKFFEHKFDLHFDDDFKEVEMINRNGGKAMLVDLHLGDIAYEIHNVTDLNKYLDYENR